MLANVTRDAETDPLVAEAGRNEVRLRGWLAIRTVLANGRRSKRALALLDVAIAFSTWRMLTREGGLDRADAVKTMVAAVACASR